MHAAPSAEELQEDPHRLFRFTLEACAASCGRPKTLKRILMRRETLS